MDEKGIGNFSPKDGTIIMSSTGSISEAQLVVYTEIGEDDVLLGRGKRSYNHGGNVRFRELVLDRALAYKQNENKAYRRALAQEIIKIVQERNGGKFVRPIEPPRGSGEAPSQWQSVPASVVLTKVKQALRDMSSGILTDHQPKKRAAAGQSALAPTLLSSIPNAMNPLLPSAFASAVLPSSHHPQLSALGLFHPRLPPQPIAQDSEYSLLMQLASLQQRQQTERMLQMMSQQRSLPGAIPSRIPGLTLQQQALLHRLNTPMPNQQLSPTLTAQQQDLIRSLNPLPNLQGPPTFDPGLQGTIHPSHQGDVNMRIGHHAQQSAGMLPPGLNPLPQQLGNVLTSRQSNNGFGTNQAEQSVSWESYNPLRAAQPTQGQDDNDNILSRGLASIPTTAGPIQNVPSMPCGPDFAQLPLLDGGVEPSANDGPDTEDEMFGDDNASIESRDDDTFNDSTAA